MYLALGMGAALALSVGVNVWQQGRIDNLNQAIGGYVVNEQTLEGEIDGLNNEIKGYVTKVAEQSVQLSYEQDRANKATQSRDEEVARLNSWRQTLANEIGDRPKVVARAAGLAFRGVLRDIARQVVNIVTAEPSGCVTTRCGCNLIEVANVGWALAQGHYGHSREELRKLWSKSPEH